MADKKEIGTVTHYFGKISVAAIELTDTLKVGDTISFEGAHTNFQQPVDSMQIENKGVTEAKAGDGVGLKVKEHVRIGDKVFLV
jgi:translation elongation factor EF-1alpha